MQLNRFSLVATIVTGVLLTATAYGQPAADGRSPVLIRFRQNPGQAERALIESAGGAVTRTFSLVPAVAARLPQAALQGISRNPNVAALEVDGTFVAHDAELDATWGAKQIGAGLVHDAGNKGTGVKVCVLDSGIDTNHPDLYMNYRGGKDFVNNDLDPFDDNGHGTHTAGTIAAMMNSMAVRGVAPQVDLYIYKVLGATGSGSFSAVIAALQECVNVGGKVTNNSYGSSTDPGSTVKAAFDNAAAAGVTHIASAGNSGAGTNTVGFPGQYSSVMAVAATDSNNVRASFSSTGPAVQISAPGVSILSTYLNDGYTYMSGTSMASPHVAGVAALVVACGITNPASVRQRIRDTALDLGAAGPDQEYGYGLVRANLAAMNCGGSLSPAPVTDLAVTAVSVPSSVTSGTSASVSVPVSNTGNQTASSFTLTLRDNGVLVATKSIPSLSAGQNSTVTFTWSSTVSGSHTLQASLDTSDANAANNSAAAVSQVVQATPIYLSVVKSVQKNGNRRVDLTWSGAQGSSVTVMRTGTSSSTTSTTNDGAYTDNIPGKGTGTFTYKVCNAGTTNCSAPVTVSF
ncbi:MAG: S8 family serine peptidase [Bryobacteraceae bacterium]